MIFSILLVLLMLLTSSTSVDHAGLQLSITLVLSILVAVYEAISRLIPTSKTWSIIGKILEVLTWLSNLFDRKKS